MYVVFSRHSLCIYCFQELLNHYVKVQGQVISQVRLSSQSTGVRINMCTCVLLCMYTLLYFSLLLVSDYNVPDVPDDT